MRPPTPLMPFCHYEATVLDALMRDHRAPHDFFDRVCGDRTQRARLSLYWSNMETVDQAIANFAPFVQALNHPRIKSPREEMRDIRELCGRLAQERKAKRND